MIDIVLPVYNEENVLAKSVETIIDFLATSGFPYPYALTLANNGSSDRTRDICVALSRKYPVIRLLQIEEKGKGNAVRQAWVTSTGEILVFMDCDLAADLQFLLPLIDKINSGAADLAIGNRLGKDSRILYRRPLRTLTSRAFNLYARLMLKTPFDDHQCGFKAVRRSSFLAINPKLKEHGWLFDTELLAVAVRQGLKVSSVDIIWTEGTESKVNLFRDPLKMFTGIIRLRCRLRL